MKKIIIDVACYAVFIIVLAWVLWLEKIDDCGFGLLIYGYIIALPGVAYLGNFTQEYFQLRTKHTYIFPAICCLLILISEALFFRHFAIGVILLPLTTAAIGGAVGSASIKCKHRILGWFLRGLLLAILIPIGCCLTLYFLISLQS